MQRAISRLGGWTLCKWHECQGCDSSYKSKDPISVESSLQSLKTDPSAMEDLRRKLWQEGDGSNLSRIDDDHIIMLVANLIQSGHLRLCGNSQGGDATTKPGGARATQRIAEDRVLRSLRTKTADFSFDGSLLRIIRADQWLEVRNEGEYQIVPREAARKAIDKMAAVPALPPTEKSALQEASSLVPDTNRSQFDNGILVLRKIPRGGTSKASSEPPATPSQLAKAREKELHWIEIELVDEDGKGVADEDYLIVTPDKQEHTGKTDEDGWARLDGIVEGQCKISFPRLDGETWKGQKPQRTHNDKVKHIVKQGECLSLIAAAHDFVDWRIIYNDAANAEFRKKRPNPHILFPGDEIIIPDRDTKPVDRETDKKHRFVLKTPRRKLNVLMLDEFKSPMKDEPCTAIAEDMMFYSMTDGKGILKLEIPYWATSVKIWIAGLERTLNLGEMNPVDDAPDEGVSGVQGRLLGLGFDPGPLDGKVGPRTRAALIAFQRHFDLKRTGEIDQDTSNRLKKEYRT